MALRRVIVFVTVVLGCGFLFQMRPFTERTGVVLNASGPVLVAYESGMDTSANGVEVFRGDTIRIGPSGSCTVLLMDSTLVRLSGPSTLLVGNDSRTSWKLSPGKKEPLSSADLLQTCQTPKLFVHSETQVRGFTSTSKGIDWSGLPTVKAILPTKTIFTTQPEFIWVDQRANIERKKEQRYTILLYEIDLKRSTPESVRYREIDRIAATGRVFVTNHLKYPRTLERAKEYFWAVFPEGEDPSPEDDFTSKTGFKTLDQQLAARIDNDLACYENEFLQNRIDASTYRLMRASCFKKHRMKYEASLEYEHLGEILKRTSYPYEEVAILTQSLGEYGDLVSQGAVERIKAIRAARQ